MLRELYPFVSKVSDLNEFCRSKYLLSISKPENAHKLKFLDVVSMISKPAKKLRTAVKSEFPVINDESSDTCMFVYIYNCIKTNMSLNATYLLYMGSVVASHNGVEHNAMQRMKLMVDSMIRLNMHSA